jgi:hypothetical protein
LQLQGILPVLRQVTRQFAWQQPARIAPHIGPEPTVRPDVIQAAYTMLWITIVLRLLIARTGVA